MSDDDKEMESYVFFSVPCIGGISRGSLGAVSVLHALEYHLYLTKKWRYFIAQIIHWEGNEG